MALLAMASCSKMTDELPAQADGLCAVTFSCTPEPQTSLLTRGLTPEEESRVGDLNLYAFHPATGTREHLYLEGRTTGSMNLLPGEWEFYAVANLGTDLGPLEAGTVEGLRVDIPFHDPDDTDFLLPMAGRTEVDVSGPVSVTLTLERLAARVRLDIRADADAEDELTVVDVQPISVPSGVFCFPGDAVREFGDQPKQECGASAFSAVYYLPENLAGEASHITSPGERTHLNAPKHATGFRITALYEGKLVYYHVYPGGNDTSDFNVRRNRHYILNVTIYGANPADLRVTTCDLRLSSPRPEVRVGESIPVIGYFDAVNCKGIVYDISYRALTDNIRFITSEGSVTSWTAFSGLSGSNISRDFLAIVECLQAGPATMECKVVDSRGGSLTRTVELEVLPVRTIDIRTIFRYGHRAEAEGQFSYNYLRRFLGITVETSEPLPAPMTVTCDYWWRQHNSKAPLSVPSKYVKTCTVNMNEETLSVEQTLLLADKADAAVYSQTFGFKHHGEVITDGGIDRIQVSDPPAGYEYNILPAKTEYVGPEISAIHY